MKHLALLVLFAASAFAADTNRIKDLSQTATSPGASDYFVIDSSASGTRKILASNILANTSVTAGTYGNATTIPVITLSAKGIVTSVSNVAVTGGGGGSATTNATDLTTGTLSASLLPALSGGDATAAIGTGNIILGNVNSNIGTYGNATTVPALTVNAKGLVTGITNVTISAGTGNTSATTTMTTNNIAVGAGTTNIKSVPVSINSTSGDIVTAGNVTGNVGTFTTGAYTTLNATTINAGNAIGSGNIILSPGGLTVTTAKVLTVTNNITLTGTDGTSFAFPSTNSTVVTKASNVVTFVLTIDDLADSLNYDIGYVGAAFTVTEIKAVHFGSGLSSPSVIATVKHGTNRTSGTTIEAVTVTSSTTGTSVTSAFDDATVPTDSFIWVETSGKSGTTDNLTIIVRGTYD